MTVEVVIVTEALLAPTGIVSGPVHAGEPVQPEKVATWTPDGSPSLTRTDTVDDGSLETTTRFRVMVAVNELPPLTAVGFKMTLPIVSGGGVMVTFSLSCEPAPSDAMTVAEMFEVTPLVAVRLPLVCCWVVEVQAAGIEGSPLMVNALVGLLATVTLTPPNGAGPDSVAFVITLEPPAMVVIGLPLKSSMTNEASGGMTTDPPVSMVSDCTRETRFRFAPDESL